MFPGTTVRISEGAHLGHGCTIHGATIGKNSLIGISAVVLDDAEIGNELNKIPPNEYVPAVLIKFLLVFFIMISPLALVRFYVIFFLFSIKYSLLITLDILIRYFFNKFSGLHPILVHAN